jgi:hypothetical protein
MREHTGSTKEFLINNHLRSIGEHIISPLKTDPANPSIKFKSHLKTTTTNSLKRI